MLFYMEVSEVEWSFFLESWPRDGNDGKRPSGCQRASAASALGQVCYLLSSKGWHVHSELPIVAFLRWQFCSVTKALLGAPFAAFHWLTFE